MLGLLHDFGACRQVDSTVAGDVAKNLAQTHQVSPKRSASLLDIFACSIQGLLPYGAQILLLGTMFKLSPLEISLHGYYPVVLAITAILTIIFRSRTARLPEPIKHD